MAAFFVGCRVRVVADYDKLEGNFAGLPIGAEAVITGGYRLWDCDDGTEMMGWEVNDWYIHRTEELEPVVPPHEACEAEFKATLDELLSREVKNETV